jgi:hypothetical protein
LKERRKEKRIPVENLPDCLKNIKFTIGDFGEFSATTIDASLSGLSFISVGIFENDIVTGQSLIIKIESEHLELNTELIYANVIYIKELGKDLLRFGVKFQQADALKKYQDLLEGID